MDNATFESFQAQSRALKAPKRVVDMKQYWGVDIFNDSEYAKL